LNVERGDTRCLSVAAEEAQMATYDSDFEAAMKAYRKMSQKYQNSLRKLA
jgi:hypothetical protein